MDNGAADGSRRVSSATIEVNGAIVFGPSDFSRDVGFLEREIPVRPKNTLVVRLASAPGSFLVLTILARPPVLEALEPARAAQGETVTVTLRGRNTHWSAGTTRLDLGGEVSVGGAAPGEPGPVQVVDDTTALAEVAVSATAALAPRTARVTVTPSSPGGRGETAVRADAFTVVPVEPPGAASARVVTVAGQPGASGFADGAGAAARFNDPRGIDVGPDDAVYVADSGNHRIRLVQVADDGAAIVSTAAGDGVAGFADGPASSARFQSPQGVAVSADGTVYVADALNHRVRRIAAGSVTTLAGDGEPGLRDGPGDQARFHTPSGVATDGAGNVYVADTGNSAVRLIDAAGQVHTLAGDGTTGSADSPGARFDGLVGVAVDRGLVYVYLADTGNHRIRRLDSSGTVVTLVGAERGFADGTPAEARFADPAGLAVDGAGHLIVADATNSLVRFVALGDGSAASVATLAGTGERGFADGSGAEARFVTPRGVTVGPSSTVFVADTGNHVLRRVLLPPSLHSIVPSRGRVKDSVTLRGERFDARAPERNAVRFGEITAEVTHATPVELTAVVPAGAATGAVTVETLGGRSSAAPFEVLPPAPVIADFDPRKGRPGVEVTLNGESLRAEGSETTVTFAGSGPVRVKAEVTFVSETEVRAIVPKAAVTGFIELSHLGGRAPTPDLFVVVPPEPTIEDFNPKKGPVGTLVTITGADFKADTGSTTVTFTGDGARPSALLSLVTPTLIRATVPEGTVTGPIEVSNAFGTVRTSQDFVVAPSQDYQLTVTPSSTTAVQHSSATVVVYLTSPQVTFTQLARLTLLGAPPGVKAVFEPSQITAGARSTLTLGLADAELAPGTYPMTVQAVARVDGKELLRTASLSLTVLAAGQTTLAGRVLSTDGEPILGATVSLDGRSTTTDAAGTFLLSGVTAGVDRPVMIDGRTANAPNRTYPVIAEPATVLAGLANIVPFIFYLPPIDTQYEVEYVPSQTTVATHPKVPGLKMTIPPGANLRNRDGSPVARVSITPLPPDRTPAPLPPGVSASLVYTSQPGGAVSDIAMPVTYPNLDGADAGTRVELYAFNHDTVKWYVYGFGRVSSDGRLIEPEVDPSTGRLYGLRDFSWHMPNVASGGNPGGGCGGACCSLGGGSPNMTTNPVDLSTGLKLEHETDIEFGGNRGRVSLGRVYSTDLSNARANPVTGRFGIGWKDNHDIRLTGDFGVNGSGRVIMPAEKTGRLFSYVRTDPDGARVFRTTATAEQLGDVLRRLTDGGFEYRYPDGRTQHFDSNRRLVSISDRNGNRIQLTYSGAQLTRITDPVGRSIDLEYDGSARIRKATDPLGRFTTYVYDGTGRLGQVADPLGHSVVYAYDGIGRLVSVTDKRGTVVKQISYDAAGRVSRQQFADGGAETYTYQPAGNNVSAAVVTDSLGRREVKRFDSAGYVIETTDGLGQTGKIERDPVTRLATATMGPCGCPELTREYDDRGNVVAVTDRRGNTDRTKYEPVFNQVVRRLDALERETVFTYDGGGNRTAMTNALNETTTYTYDEFGQLTGVTNPLGHTTSFEYDARGNLTARIDPLENRTSYEYDGVGNLMAIVDPMGRRTGFTHDALSRLVMTKDPAGATTTFGYDLNGNQTTRTDVLGSTWTNAYDRKNRLVGTTNPLGRTTTYRYNSDDERTAVVSPSGRTTTYDYDFRGQINAITDPLGFQVQFGYDNRGNVVTLTDERGHTTAFVYDDLFRQVGRQDPTRRTTTFAHDRVGNLVESINRKGEATDTAYDALDRPETVTHVDATVAHEYDQTGRRMRIDDTQGGSIEWAYDVADRILSERTPNGLVSYSYNAAGERVVMTAADQPSVHYGYDSAGRLVTITQGSETFIYSYDALSRRASLQRPNGVTTTYGYDTVGRLARLTHGSNAGPIEDFQYSFNLDDEIVAIASLNSTSLLPEAVTAGSADEANRLRQFGSSGFDFDAEGRMVSRVDAEGVTSFEWDARGRLVRAAPPSDAVVAYGYDALDRRILRRAAGQTMAFLYETHDVVRDTGADGGIVDYLNGRAIDDKLRFAPLSGGARFFVQDHLGSTTALTTVGGDVSESLLYEPFGRGLDGPTHYTYTGREFDARVGLYYYRARWYDARQGRFLAEDPIGTVDDVNLYRYVRNNPISKKDPSGTLSVPGFAPNTADACDEYSPCDDYLGANARCFCKCAGNDPWSQFARSCLRSLYRAGVYPNAAHLTCYTMATAQFGLWPPDLLPCYTKCFQGP